MRAYKFDRSADNRGSNYHVPRHLIRTQPGKRLAKLGLLLGAEHPDDDAVLVSNLKDPEPIAP